MYGRPPFNWARQYLTIHPPFEGKTEMNLNTVKNAAMTTISVLVVIYALNQFSVTKPFVQRALLG